MLKYEPRPIKLLQVHEGDCDDFFYSFMLSGTAFAQWKYYNVFDMVVQVNYICEGNSCKDDLIVHKREYKMMNIVSLQFIHFFVSFVILCLLNYIIVNKLRQCHRRARRQSACASVTFTIASKVGSLEI